MTRRIGVGLLGAGTVGAAVAALVVEREALTLVGALVRDPDKPRGAALAGKLTTDAEALLDQADVIVELMGGTDRASALILTALRLGKPVVTANKAVLAEHAEALAPFVAEGRVHFEAAVMAGTPVVGPLSGALRGSAPLELHAILNGTCNHIVSALEAGAAFDEALAEAQRLGYAEAEPSLDIDGVDAAHKLTVLARLAFDPALAWQEVRASARGIRGLTPTLVKNAMEDGGRIRLVGSVFAEAGAWRAKVRPVYLPAAHPLASASASRNALLFCGEPVGEVFIAGAGAGAGPTASAVVADILAAAAGRPGPTPLARAAPLPDAPASAPLQEVA